MPASSAPTTSSCASSPTCSTSCGSTPTAAAAAWKIGVSGLPLPKARALKRRAEPTADACQVDVCIAVRHRDQRIALAEPVEAGTTSSYSVTRWRSAKNTSKAGSASCRVFARAAQRAADRLAAQRAQVVRQVGAFLGRGLAQFAQHAGRQQQVGGAAAHSAPASRAARARRARWWARSATGCRRGRARSLRCAPTSSACAVVLR